MRRCVQLARCGKQGVAPNPMVGAVLVWHGKIIGEGYHARFGEAHAEVRAIAACGDEKRLRESTLYVSLEPCAHYGKTPPCAELIIRKGIPRVVIGVQDPFARVQGRGIQMLREAGVEVEVGILENECRRLNEQFFTAHTLHRPFITLKWAQSADGFAAPEGNRPGNIFISNRRTLARVHRLRSEHQAILVGSGTALVDNPSLTLRYAAGRQPVRVVLDRYGKLPLQLSLFDGSVPTMVFGYRDNPERAVAEGRNYRFCRLQEGEDAIGQMLRELYGQGINSLLVEGGPTLQQLFIDAGLWDRIHIEVGPQVFGKGVEAPSLAAVGSPSVSEVGGELPDRTSEQLAGHTLITIYNPRPSPLVPNTSSLVPSTSSLACLCSRLTPLWGEGEGRAVLRTLLEDKFGLIWTQVLTHSLEGLLDEAGLRSLEQAVEQLAAGTPVQHITERARFCGLNLRVSPEVLIPRPETERLVELCLRGLPTEAAILDIGTGSGCIALALARGSEGCSVTAIDVSREALTLARQNIQTQEERLGRKLGITLLQADMTQPTTMPAGQWDMIVSNPPYVHPEEREEMAVWVKDHEPALALFTPPDDGLYFYRHIARYALSHLKPGGHLCLEINPRCAGQLKELLEGEGFLQVEMLPDDAGHLRFATAQL